MSTKSDLLDPRIRRTRQGLRQALMELVLEKDYRKITVTDLTSRAYINRSTFYLHYPEKDSLLKSGFQEFWDQELPVRSILPEDGLNQLTDRLQAELEIDLVHFEKFKDFYRTMLCDQRVLEFREQLNRHLLKVLQQRFSLLRAIPSSPAAFPTLSVVYLGSAYLGVLEWWLSAQDPASVGEIASQLSVMFLQPFGHMETQEEVYTEERVRIKEIY